MISSEENAMRAMLLSALVGLCLPVLATAADPSTPASTARARILVHLPAEAKLTVDGDPTISTSDTRLLVSPPLPLDRKMHYTFEAQIVRDGKTLKVEKDVPVQAGYLSELTIDFPQPGVRTSYYSPEASAVKMTRLEEMTPPPIVYFAPPAPYRIPEIRHTHWGLDQSDPFYYTWGQ
jgi:uncharacterized protein (TIGR03000 family)